VFYNWFDNSLIYSACTIDFSVLHVENKKLENNRIIFFPILNSTSVLHVENKKHKNNRIIFFPIVQIKLNNWIWETILIGQQLD
jgi:predicted nucleic acid-binding Zn ribbon protein